MGKTWCPIEEPSATGTTQSSRYLANGHGFAVHPPVFNLGGLQVRQLLTRYVLYISALYVAIDDFGLAPVRLIIIQ